MRLINPGLGELLDRLTILELKLAHGGEAHFAREGEEVRGLLAGRLAQAALAQGPEVLCNLVVRLAAINGALWQAEDDLRARRFDQREANLVRSGVLAHQIQMLNDKRSALVRELSRAGGEDWAEKM